MNFFTFFYIGVFGYGIMFSMNHSNIIAATILGASIAFASIFHGCSTPRYEFRPLNNSCIGIFDNWRGEYRIITTKYSHSYLKNGIYQRWHTETHDMTAE